MNQFNNWHWLFWDYRSRIYYSRVWGDYPRSGSHLCDRGTAGWSNIAGAMYAMTAGISSQFRR